MEAVGFLVHISGVGAGGSGGASALQKFRSVKKFGKMSKIWAKKLRHF